MSKKRLIYIAGLSNDAKIGSFIQKDISNMKSIFENYENEGQVILRTDEIVTTTSLRERFSNTKVLPWLFYFSGHSDVNQIQMSDGTIAKKNFTDIFNYDRIIQNLQLVYLSSCKSFDIADTLCYEKKVKVVIASTANVNAGLSNIISKFFFNQFLFSDNIQQAFNQAKNFYKIDREKFNINQNVDFPWILLSSNESNLDKPLKKIKLSPEQKHQILMNSTSIRLNLLDYYLNEDKSNNKNHGLTKEEVKVIKDNLDSSITIVDDENENIQTLLDIWKTTTSLEVFPKQKRILNSNKEFKKMKSPEIFKNKTRNQIINMTEIASKIID